MMPLEEIYTQMIEYAAYIMAPPYCAHCLQLLSIRTPLCTACSALIRPLITHQLTISPTITMPVHALGAYEPPLTALIRAKQYRNSTAAHQLGMLIIQQLTIPHPDQRTVLIPIPLHWQRYAWRGFNQAEIIAHILGKHYHIPVLPLLTRTRATPFQSLQRKGERRENVAQAFAWNEHYNPADYDTVHYILVDDLMTTGATLTAAAQTLVRVSSPASVQAIVAARVP